MSLYGSMKELIGNTPLVRLSNSGFPEELQVYAKLELYNPSGSVKDRIGKYMVEDAVRKGILKPGDTIIEATAGNTGLGIAFAALNQGYRQIFLVPEKFSREKQTLLKALGAEIINTPLEEGMLGAAKAAEKLRAQIPDSVTLEQFKNSCNPLAHYETTGPEIYRDLNGTIDYVVAGAGSGGTFTGVLKYLKEQNPQIKGILADPVGSTLGGGEHSNYEIEGIGNDFIADTMDMSLVDQVIKVNDREAFEEVKNIAGNEGIFAGSSSGAALAAVKKLAKTVPSGNVVVIFPDRGDRYFSKHIFD
ncbi:cysteine synthase family protein [Lachnospiraceae bacterium 54-53]